MRTFFPKFAIKKYSMYVAMTVIFVHNYVLDEDLNCTCDAEGSCFLYMFLPFLILFALQLWTDERFKGVWKYSWSTCKSPTYTCSKFDHSKFDCSKCDCSTSDCYEFDCSACDCSTCNCTSCCKCGCKFFLVFCFHIMKAVCIGLLWVLSVFIDGDWFVCCWNTYEENPQLGCKDKEYITAEERVLIAKLKNKSMIIGLGILSAGFLVVSLLLPCGLKKCCEKKCRICCDRKLLYDQMILEEEENVLTEVIRKAAKDKLTEEMQKKLDSDRCGECFDVAEKLIEKKTPAGDKDNIPLENKEPGGDKQKEESDSEKRTTKVKEAVRVKYREQQKYISSEGQLTYTSFMECVAKKFNIQNLDLKVFDDSKTEVDEDVFDFLMEKQNLGVLEICQAQGPNPDDSSASTSFTSSSVKIKVDSDDTTLLEHSPTTRRRADDTSLAREAQPLIETVSEKTSAK